MKRKQNRLKIRYAYLFSGSYIFLTVLFLLGYLKGAGHGSNPFGFLFAIVFSACQVLDLVYADKPTNEWLHLAMCVALGFVIYGLIGAGIDLVINRSGNDS